MRIILLLAGMFILTAGLIALLGIAGTMSGGF